MLTLDIFNEDAFGVAELTAAINRTEAVPSLINDLRLFKEKGVTTTTVSIEYADGKLDIVPAKPRGGIADRSERGRRKLVPFSTVHLPVRDVVNADEVLNVRAFGKSSELQVVQSVVNDRLKTMRARLDLTHEWQRIGAIKGEIYDADGSTVLLDLFNTFGIEQLEIEMGLGTASTSVRIKSSRILDMIGDELGNTPFRRAHALCGQSFWESLIEHKSVKETYLNTLQGAELRGDARESFEFGGIYWERYRGKVGTKYFVENDNAYVFPVDVDGLFITRFAPADYMETVGTIGLPYYAKQRLLPFDKGVELESQSNPLHLCTRPRAVIKLIK